MFTRNRVHTHESGTTGGIIRRFTASSLCISSKEPRPNRTTGGRGINISGVDFWHAVEFSRNGRFLCTHPLGLSSGLSLRLRFRLYQIFPIRFPRCFPGSTLSRFPFRRFRLYQILSGLIPGQSGVVFPAVRAVPTSETLADSRLPTLIGVLRPFGRGFLIPRIRTPMTRRQTDCWRRSEWYLRDGCPGTDRSRRSRRTTRRTLRIPRVVSTRCRAPPAGRTRGRMTTRTYSQLGGPPDGGRPHVCTQRPPPRRPFSFSPSGSSGGGRPGTAALDQERDET